MKDQLRLLLLGALPARAALLLALGLGLSGCDFWSDEELLEGTRLPVRPAEETIPAASVPLSLPPVQAVADWTHRAQNPAHLAPHAELASGLRLVWSADVGAGDSSRARLTASPVVAGERVFAMSAEAEVVAFSTSGAEIWRVSLVPEGENGSDGFGGGLAVAGGTLYVSTGFGEVVALDAATGELRWRRNVGAPIRSAPTVSGPRVLVVARDDQAYGLDAGTGEIVWRLQGASGTTGFLGGASPAADDVLAILPFASGEVSAVLALSGRRIWTSAIAGGRRGLARTGIGDISSDPVIAGEVIYAANQSGRLISVDRRTGTRNWTANTGSYNAVLPAGGSLFVLSDTAELLRLDPATGGRIWGTQLPEFEDPEDRTIAIGYGGPILAGGRLIITSMDGVLLSFDPETGQETGRVTLPGGSAIPPAVAGGRLYVMASDGTLLAFQ